jgi:hypothetical protein
MKKDDLEAYELNDGHIIEAIDRIHVTSLHIDAALIEHPLINALPQLEKKIEDAQQMLLDVYHEIGRCSTISELKEKYTFREGYSIRESQDQCGRSIKAE